MLPASLADLRAKLDLLEDADYLRFTESGFLHLETPSGRILYLRLVQVFEGTSNSMARFEFQAYTCKNPPRATLGASGALRVNDKQLGNLKI